MQIQSQDQNFGERLEVAISAMMDLLNDGQAEWRRMNREIIRIGRNLDDLKQTHEKLTDRVFQIEDWSRKPFAPSTVKAFVATVLKYFHGLCPCCGENRILNHAGIKTADFEVDHFKSPKWCKITEGWPICKQCHSRLTHGYLSRDGWVEQAFKAFQVRVRQCTAGLEEGGGDQPSLF